MWHVWARNTKYSQAVLYYCTVCNYKCGVEYLGPRPRPRPTFSSRRAVLPYLPTPCTWNMSSRNSSCPQPRPCLHHVTHILHQIQHALPCRVNVLCYVLTRTYLTQYRSLCRPLHAIFS